MTVKLVESAKARDAQYEESDGEGGLVLVVYPSGAKSWAVRYRNAAGKQRKKSLGPIDRMKLADARKAARAIMARVDDGDDPSSRAKVEADKAALTVRSASERFMKARRAQERNRAADEVQRQFDSYILPAIGEGPIAAVSGDNARKVVTDLANAGARTMANRVHSTLARFFKWAAEPDQRLVAQSPYAGYPKVADERERDRVLSSSELAALWHEAGVTAQPFGPIIRLLILTAQRRSEVTGMTDAELDLNRAEWTIPSDRAKNGDRHVVPLSKPAIAELAKVTRIGKKGLVFTTTGEAVYAGHHKAKARMDRALGFNEPWRIHDIRRTATTGLIALGQQPATVEALLNHRTGARAGVAGVYNRHQYRDEMELAAEVWGRFIVDVIAIDTRRLAYDRLRLRERAAFNAAIQSDELAWSEYLAVLDDPSDAREAA
ncbi:MAG: integrase arm-type DNA-binding domain-containing protein [Erythrobacter sp.]|nr:integrase arm-type DNA-binding domain-containing protein [Erythrobacter sp.]